MIFPANLFDCYKTLSLLNQSLDWYWQTYKTTTMNNTKNLNNNLLLTYV